MKRCITALVIISCASFLYGVRPAIDLYGGWNYSNISVEGVSTSDNFVDMAIMVTAPFSDYAGMRAGLVGLNFGGGGTAFHVAGRIGFIEMIPGAAVSPYFTQQVTMDIYSVGGLNMSDIELCAGVGVEFLSNSPVSPFFEGRFAFAFMNIEDISGNGIGIGLGGGVRFGAPKRKEIEEKRIEFDL